MVLAARLKFRLLKVVNPSPQGPQVPEPIVNKEEPVGLKLASTAKRFRVSELVVDDELLALALRIQAPTEFRTIGLAPVEKVWAKRAVPLKFT